jgi:hypothetical protein
MTQLLNIHNRFQSDLERFFFKQPHFNSLNEKYQQNI